MNIYIDIRDWLGGWPMEFVYDQEAIDFCGNLGFKLTEIATGQRTRNFSSYKTSDHNSRK